MELSDPQTVHQRAKQLASNGATDPILNLIVEGNPTPGRITHTDTGYEGPQAGYLGRLAVATEVANESIRLHYPQPETTVSGPWLVLEPLAGYIATVHTGKAQLDVTLTVENTTNYRRLETLQERITTVLQAAQPTHAYYPVSDDTQGIFTRGMTTYSLTSIRVNGNEATISFDVSVTPATTSSTVTETFEEIEGVTTVKYTPTVGVERSDPTDTLRNAIERAHVDVIGDSQYEWYTEPTIFSRLPTTNKIAIGMGMPDASTFSMDTFETHVALLRSCIQEVAQ
ncbi:MAG: hypothetical protein ABEI86_14945 [Halobacteriaceae archaeon]